MSNQIRGFVDQALATCYNYIHTSRCGKAIELMAVIKRIEPNNTMVTRIFDLIHSPVKSQDEPDVIKDFMGEYWEGQSLNEKSIQVFCDQGMGDTINLLRYLYVMKEKWNCRIVLNKYDNFFQFSDLLKQIDVIDEFTNEHTKCDYNTNIMSIPAILNNLKYAVYYPAHFLDLLDHTNIPVQHLLSSTKGVIKKPGRPCVGVSWSSNPENILSLKKSISDEEIKQLEEVEGINFFSLIPHSDLFESGVKLLPLTKAFTLDHTSAIIAEMDVVVSVDTVVLHLAGAMGKTTFGLLPFEADPRWSKCGNSEVVYEFGDTKKYETSVWYPSVRMFRQEKEGDWSVPLRRIKEELKSIVL